MSPYSRAQRVRKSSRPWRNSGKLPVIQWPGGPGGRGASTMSGLLSCCETRRRSGATLAQVGERLLQVDDVGEAGLNVEQRPLVRDLGAVLHGLADDDRPQLVALGVRGRGPHAGAGRAPCDEQSVHAAAEEV